MKKLILITALFMIYSMNANSVVLYIEDDMGSGGGYSGSYTPTSSSMNIIGTNISEAVTAVGSLQSMLIYETDPGRIQEYNNKIASIEQDMQVIQQQVQINLEAAINKQNYIMNLLSNIMKMLHDIALQIIRNISS